MSRNRSLEEIQEDIRTLTRVPSEFIHAKLNELAEEVEELVKQKWIPITERMPKEEEYILVSFENCTLPDIGRYENDGNDKFYPGDDEETYASYGLIVNAWMPLPERYKG